MAEEARLLTSNFDAGRENSLGANVGYVCFFLISRRSRLYFKAPIILCGQPIQITERWSSEATIRTIARHAKEGFMRDDPSIDMI